MVVCLLLPVSAKAQTVEVKDAWIRGTVPAQKATGAFMDITSKAAVRLVALGSPVAGRVELHNMKMESGVMKMFPVDGIAIAAGKTVKLAPGGYHVMLIDLNRQLKQGDRVPLKLTFELADKSRQTIDISAEVRDIKGEPRHKH